MVLYVIFKVILFVINGLLFFRLVVGIFRYKVFGVLSFFSKVFFWCLFKWNNGKIFVLLLLYLVKKVVIFLVVWFVLIIVLVFLLVIVYCVIICWCVFMFFLLKLLIWMLVFFSELIIVFIVGLIFICKEIFGWIKVSVVCVLVLFVCLL